MIETSDVHDNGVMLMADHSNIMIEAQESQSCDLCIEISFLSDALIQTKPHRVSVHVRVCVTN